MAYDARHLLQIESRDVPVDAIDTQAVLSVLPLWQEIPETASRLRAGLRPCLITQRRTASGQARTRPHGGHLALILPKRGKLSRGHHAAMDYRDVPAFIARLREQESVAALALEFVILGAAGEVLGARWSEIDLAAKVWTVPCFRMKGGAEHRVPLSLAAITVLEKMAAIRSCDFVFPGQRRGQGLGQAALWRLCSGAGTVHGFRSSFRDWCGNETSYPREIAEQALAHATGNAVEAAYRRSDALEKRRALMEAWASYCEPRGAENNSVLLGRK